MGGPWSTRREVCRVTSLRLTRQPSRALRQTCQDLAIEHQEAAEGDAAVDEAHGQVDHGHALELHALDDEHGEIGQQRQEREHDDIDQRPQQARRAGRQQLVSSSTAMCELRRVTTAPPMNVTHISP